MRHSVRAAIDPVDPFANNMGWSIDFHHRLLTVARPQFEDRSRTERAACGVAPNCPILLHG